MKSFKNKEAIIKHIPKFNDEDLKEINECFTPYLFFKDYGKYRKCTCTRCREEFEYPYQKKEMDPSHYEFITKKHNEYATCPKCRKQVLMKNESYVKSCSSLEEWQRAVIVKPIGNNQIYLIGIYAEKNYYGKNYLTKPEISIGTVYYLTPENVKIFKNAYDYTFLGLRNGNFYEPKSIIEPFTKTFCYNISSIEKRGYYLLCTHRLRNTFLRYIVGTIKDFQNVWEKFHSRYYLGPGFRSISYETPICKYLAYSAKFTSAIEKLMKIDLGYIVCSLINGVPMKRVMNWNADEIRKILDLNKSQIKELTSCNDSLLTFKLYQSNKKKIPNLKITFCSQMEEKLGYLYTVELLNLVKKYSLNLTHTVNFLQKSNKIENRFELWRDYIKFAKDIEFDLSRSDVIFPKNLKKAHDKASSIAAEKADEIAFKKYKGRYEKLKNLYEYCDGKYEVVIPKGINDIVREGNMLKHCVGGYAERHCRGVLTILFIRKVNDPNKSLLTMELKNSGVNTTIAQIHGMKNRYPNSEEQTFVDEWFAWVRAGSKRKENKVA